MHKVLHLQQLLLRSRRLPLLVIGLTLVILGGTILWASLQLRQKVRDQIIRRDAEVLHAVARMLQYEAASATNDLVATDDQISQSVVLLKTSRLGGVLAARLYDRDGQFVEAFPPDVLDAPLDPACLRQLIALRPVSRFHEAARLADIFAPDRSASAGGLRAVPLLEVNVPLSPAGELRLGGIAQFILEGQSLATEYTRLDRHLALQAFVALLVSGAILALSISWAFRRVGRASHLLAERTQDLVLANQELALAAKTSAVGAVTSHLIHGLKSPLSGLQSFVTSVSATQDDRLAADWQQAIASTRRMQNLINQVVSVLREEEAGRHYEVTLAELAAIVSDRVLPLARERGVQFQTRLEGEAGLPNRTANLLALILVNLSQNALEATPSGTTVTLALRHPAGTLECEVSDEGPGFPEALRPHLFKPCQSSKEAGSGIGLAICKQLANHLGASLELRRSAPPGCVFALTLPATFCERTPQTATVTLSG
jgi:signal transduction histidine kinase